MEDGGTGMVIPHISQEGVVGKDKDRFISGDFHHNTTAEICTNYCSDKQNIYLVIGKPAHVGGVMVSGWVDGKTKIKRN